MRLVLLLLVLLRPSGDPSILFRKNADDPGSNFVMYYGLVVLPDDIDTGFDDVIALGRKVPILPPR